MSESETESILPEVLAELRTVDRALHRLDGDRDSMIRAARRSGATWAQIGEALGTTKQAAWERFRRLDPVEEVSA